MTESLPEILQHVFSDPGLLEEALTHGSVMGAHGGDYQRLEFLGDRVLSLVVAELLYRAYPKENEGKLARRFVALVRREALAEVAAKIGLGDHLILSPSEAESGGRKNPSLLADVCEAVIAALYLDGGLAPTAAFINRHWKALMAREETPPTDAKTSLQELLQGRGLPLPVYRIVGRTGPDHAPEFTIEVAAGDARPVTGLGLSRRAAEQQAAAAALVLLDADV
jgi:ribonuclease-3